MLKLQNYCNKYNVPMQSLVDVISDLKVIPMIRGKAFEFTAVEVLQHILPKNNWKVEHLNMNAQQGTKDIDVSVTRLSDNKEINVECKLTKNDSFKIEENKAVLRVKCMRSRTFSDNAAATRMATNYKVNRELLLMHADSYRMQDFDFVVTTLCNSFWTSEEDGQYTFSGKIDDYKFLKELFPNKFTSFDRFQSDAYYFLLFARSKDIAVAKDNNLACTRKKCINNKTHQECGFIPNYPVVNLNDVAEGKSPWKLIENIESEFKKF
jgi:hypothetical protein